MSKSLCHAYSSINLLFKRDLYMTIIVQAGHKTSKSKQVMEKLYERGLSRPNDSYTHKMTSEQVSETLYKVFARENISVANEKIADNIMTDFLLANLDAENWGWESDKNLTSLEYWGQIEPDVGFILVFDHPKRLFDNIETEKLTTDSVDKIVDEWVLYHQGILKILEAGNDRSILIEGQSALQSIPNLNTQLVKIGSNIKLKSAWQIVNTQPIDLDSKKAQDPNFVSELIIDEILKNYPEAINIFNNLLSKANLKISSPIYKTQRPKLVDLIESLGCVQSNTQSIIDEYELKLSVLEQEKSDLVLLADNRKVVSIESRLQTAKNNIQSLEAELKKKTSINSQVNSSANIADIEKENENENELLIVQIHQLQESLERYYEEKEKYSLANIEKILVKKDQENQRLNKELQESNSKRQDLENKLKKIDNKIEEQTQSVNSNIEKEILIVQMYQIQEELERYYIENQKLKNIEVSKSERTIRDLEQQPTHYGAAERIKQDLPYRLGEKIVKAKQPKHIVSLPFVLAKEYSDFQKNEVSVEKLPSIKLYKDAYEAEKIKKQLSYKLGVVVTTEVKSYKGLLSLPFKIVKEVVDFKLKVKAK